jgi:hypothetical protein
MEIPNFAPALTLAAKHLKNLPKYSGIGQNPLVEVTVKSRTLGFGSL